mmetsp:Transcript_27160/g.40656  ORF Transcript_27160/g.40656 Transcript_27160/m.40656 type:complete len:101 (+) Transcript_27160:538-840(+)
MVIGICAGYAIIDGADCRAVGSIAGMAVVMIGAAVGMVIGIIAEYGAALTDAAAGCMTEVAVGIAATVGAAYAGLAYAGLAYVTGVAAAGLAYVMGAGLA